MLQATPFTLLSVQSSSTSVTAGEQYRSWRQATPIGSPVSSRVQIEGVVCLSQNVSAASGEWGTGNKGSFSPNEHSDPVTR